MIVHYSSSFETVVPKVSMCSHTNKCTIISVCLIQRQIGGSHNAYFKQEISVYLLLTEMQVFVCVLTRMGAHSFRSETQFRFRARPLWKTP